MTSGSVTSNRIAPQLQPPASGKLFIFGRTILQWSPVIRVRAWDAAQSPHSLVTICSRRTALCPDVDGEVEVHGSLVPLSQVLGDVRGGVSPTQLVHVAGRCSPEGRCVGRRDCGSLRGRRWCSRVRGATGRGGGRGEGGAQCWMWWASKKRLTRERAIAIASSLSAL
jgi:hypothetical protein